MIPINYLVCSILMLMVNIAALYAEENSNIDKELNFAASDYCPFPCDPDTENGKEGIMIEVFRLNFEPLGYRVGFKIMPYSRAVEEVKSYNYDGIAVVIKSHAPNFIYQTKIFLT